MERERGRETSRGERGFAPRRPPRNYSREGLGHARACHPRPGDGCSGDSSSKRKKVSDWQEVPQHHTSMSHRVSTSWIHSRQDQYRDIAVQYMDTRSRDKYSQSFDSIHGPRPQQFFVQQRETIPLHKLPFNRKRDFRRQPLRGQYECRYSIGELPQRCEMGRPKKEQRAYAAPVKDEHRRETKPLTRDSGFNMKVRAIHRIVKLSHHLKNVTDMTLPTLIRKLADQLAYSIKPALPNEETVGLIMDNAKQWESNTVSILKNHYQTALTAAVQAMPKVTKNNWQEPFEVAKTWATRKLGERLREETLERTETLLKALAVEEGDKSESEEDSFSTPPASKKRKKKRKVKNQGVGVEQHGGKKHDISPREGGLSILPKKNKVKTRPVEGTERGTESDSSSAPPIESKKRRKRIVKTKISGQRQYDGNKKEESPLPTRIVGKIGSPPMLLHKKYAKIIQQEQSDVPPKPPSNQEEWRNNTAWRFIHEEETSEEDREFLPPSGVVPIERTQDKSGVKEEAQWDTQSYTHLFPSLIREVAP